MPWAALGLVRVARVLIVLVALLLLACAAVASLGVPAAPPTAGALPGASQNDAGSGQDAGDTPASAILVGSARRAYVANLTPPGMDADWYRHAVDEAFCSVADATTSSSGVLTVSADAGGRVSASRFVEPHRSARLALAAPAGHTPFLGFEPTALRAAIEGDATGRDPGRYTFNFQSFRLADLDPEADGESPEAGAFPAASVPLPGECLAGRVSSPADAEDAFHLDVAGSRVLTVSFALAGPGDARLDVLSPTGALRASLASGEAADVWADEPGRWHLVVRAPAPAPALAPLGLAALPTGQTTTTVDYLVGVTDGPGSSNPCRPSCQE